MDWLDEDWALRALNRSWANLYSACARSVSLLLALPLVLALPLKVRVGLLLRDRGGIPNWPPYYAPALNSKATGVKGWVTDRQTVFSDQPWAVAWYADRLSIWLPPTREDFVKLENVAADLQTPCVGILISPSSHGSGPVASVAERYKDFTALVLDGRVLLATNPPGFTIFDKSPKIQEIAKRYPYRQPLVGMDMIYYSERIIRPKERAVTTE